MKRAGLLSLPALFGLFGAAPPLPFASPVPEPLPLRFQVDPADRMTVMIRLGGGSSHRFLVDTGAEQSAVSTELARTMHFARHGQRRVLSFAGEQRVPVVRIPEMTINRRVHRKFDVLLFGRDAIGADGLLGIDRLADQQVRFDFERRTLAISPAPKVSAIAADGEVLVRARLRDGRMVMSKASANRVAIDVVLDTGTSISMGNLALRNALAQTHRIGPLRRIHMLAITGEVVAIDYGIIRQVTIDRAIVIDRMPIAFAVSQPFDRLGLGERPAMLLGMDVLRSFGEVTVDFRNRKVRFKGRDDAARVPAPRFGFEDI